MTIGGIELLRAPEAITGRRIAYVGQQTLMRSGTVRDNLYYGLMHRPVREATYSAEDFAAREREIRECALSGNSPHDFNADWIDYASAGVQDPQSLTARALDVLQVVDMARDIYELGLQGRIDSEQRPELARSVLQAREELHTRLADAEFANLVESFERDKFNTNMSVGENLLFGAPLDPRFEIDQLPQNEDVLVVLREFDLENDFVEMGRQVADLMVELFTGVEPGSPVFEQFSFISADDLPIFRSVLSRAEARADEPASVEDRQMLLSLPFKLVMSRHRLGLIDQPLQERILQARGVLLERFGGPSGQIEPFDSQRVNSAVSIQDNILFGRLAYGRARSAAQVGGLLREVVEKLDLRESLMEVGLDFHVGIGGSRLSGAQRQKLAIARAVLKRPDILVLDEATASLDEQSQQVILDNLFKEFAGRTLFWLLHRANIARLFDQILILEDGKAVLNRAVADISDDEELDKHIAAASRAE